MLKLLIKFMLDLVTRHTDDDTTAIPQPRDRP
jgi:hypothetical protein